MGVSSLIATNFDDTVVVNGKTMRFAAAAFGALEGLKQQYYRGNNVPEETQAEINVFTHPQWIALRTAILESLAAHPDARESLISRLRAL